MRARMCAYLLHAGYVWARKKVSSSTDSALRPDSFTSTLYLQAVHHVERTNTRGPHQRTTRTIRQIATTSTSAQAASSATITANNNTTTAVTQRQQLLLQQYHHHYD